MGVGWPKFLDTLTPTNKSSPSLACASIRKTSFSGMKPPGRTSQSYPHLYRRKSNNSTQLLRKKRWTAKEETVSHRVFLRPEWYLGKVAYNEVLSERLVERWTPRESSTASSFVSSLPVKDIWHQAPRRRSEYFLALQFLKLELICCTPRVIKFSIQYASLGRSSLYFLELWPNN